MRSRRTDTVFSRSVRIVSCSSLPNGVVDAGRYFDDLCVLLFFLQLVQLFLTDWPGKVVRDDWHATVDLHVLRLPIVVDAGRDFDDLGVLFFLQLPQLVQMFLTDWTRKCTIAKERTPLHDPNCRDVAVVTLHCQLPLLEPRSGTSEGYCTLRDDPGSNRGKIVRSPYCLVAA